MAECVIMKYNKTSSRISNGSQRRKRWSWNVRNAKSSSMLSEGKKESMQSAWQRSERNRRKNGKQGLRLENRK